MTPPRSLCRPSPPVALFGLSDSRRSLQLNTGVSLTEKPGAPLGYPGLPYPRSGAPEEPTGNRHEEEVGTAHREAGRTG